MDERRPSRDERVRRGIPEGGETLLGDTYLRGDFDDPPLTGRLGDDTGDSAVMESDYDPLDTYLYDTANTLTHDPPTHGNPHRRIFEFGSRSDEGNFIERKPGPQRKHTYDPSLVEFGRSLDHVRSRGSFASPSTLAHYRQLYGEDAGNRLYTDTKMSYSPSLSLSRRSRSRSRSPETSPPRESDLRGHPPPCPPVMSLHASHHQSITYTCAIRHEGTVNE